MTRPLRRLHAGIWMVLPLLLAALLAAGVIARKVTQPPNPDLRWEKYR